MSAPTPFTDDELLAPVEPLLAVPRAVRFQDVDAAGTVYFPRLFEYTADAYIALLEARGLDLAATLRARAWAAPYAHAEADFRAPLFYGDRVVVEVVAARAGRTSFSLGYRIRAPDEPARVHCLARTTHVCIDLQTLRPRPLPDDLRRALAPVLQAHQQGDFDHRGRSTSSGE